MKPIYNQLQLHRSSWETQLTNEASCYQLLQWIKHGYNKLAADIDHDHESCVAVSYMQHATHEVQYCQYLELNCWYYCACRQALLLLTLNGSSLTHDLSIPPDQLATCNNSPPANRPATASSNKPASQPASQKQQQQENGSIHRWRQQCRQRAAASTCPRRACARLAWTLAEVQRSVGYEGREKHTHRKFTATNVHCVLHHSPLYFPLIPPTFLIYLTFF